MLPREKAPAIYTRLRGFVSRDDDAGRSEPRRGRLRIVTERLVLGRLQGAMRDELQTPGSAGLQRGSERQLGTAKFWLLTTNHREWVIFRAGLTRANRFGADKILAILCRANSADVTKDLRKVLLGLEAAGNGDVQYSRIRSTQHRLSALKPQA